MPFYSKAVPVPPHLLIVGPPRCGKSTAITALVRLIRERHVPVGGFVTHEQRRDGRRVGFVVQGIEGAAALIAHEGLDGPVRVGRYGVDVAAFERVALPALRWALDAREIVVVDEIARMELASEPFRTLITEAFDGPAPVVATVHVHPHPFTDALKQRGDVEIFELTKDNRDELPGLLLARLTRW